jgi:hypothetical protein
MLGENNVLLHVLELTNKSKKRKATPLQACTDPEGSRRLRLTHFKTINK